MRLGGPLQGRDEVVIKEELTAREVAGGLDGPDGEDGMVGWHGPGGPGGELSNERRIRSSGQQPSGRSPEVDVGRQ